jgi:hypothetical protein
VDWEAGWEEPFSGYAKHFGELIGDQRTRVTFEETLKGIIGAGRLVCGKIAAHSAVLSKARDGGQRVIRFAKGKSTKRSQVDAEHLVEKLCDHGVEQLGLAETDEVWLILDGSELCKPYAQEMPDLMEVRDLKGKLVPGYRTLNVLGVTPKRRGILYHRLFSSKEETFVSEPLEVQKALWAVSKGVEPLRDRMAVSWIMDRGFDDVAVWRTVWEQGEHLVCRVFHTERLVEYRQEDGEWVEGNLESARQRLQPLAKVAAEMLIRLGRQTKAKLQRVTAEVRACPVRLTYETNVRREGPGEELCKPLWLVEVQLLRSSLKPWLLITDRPVTDAASAVQVFRMYRQRWAVEDSFKFTKECLGWEEVQLLNLQGIRTLVALAWVAAGFLYELGITLDWPEVQLLAKLGGWTPRKDRKPGKIVLTQGLRRLLDMLVTQSLLDQHVTQHGALPPKIAAMLHHRPRSKL